MDTFSSGGVWLFSGTTHYSTSIKFIVLNAQTSCFIKRCYDREQCRIQTLKKRWGGWGGGGLQNIFLGPAAINRVEGNIETFSTRVRSREKEYESEITVVVYEQIPSDDLFWYFIFGVFKTILSLLVVPAYPGRKRTIIIY